MGERQSRVHLGLSDARERGAELGESRRVHRPDILLEFVDYLPGPCAHQHAWELDNFLHGYAAVLLTRGFEVKHYENVEVLRHRFGWTEVLGYGFGWARVLGHGFGWARVLGHRFGWARVLGHRFGWARVLGYRFGWARVLG